MNVRQRRCTMWTTVRRPAFALGMQDALAGLPVRDGKIEDPLRQDGAVIRVSSDEVQKNSPPGPMDLSPSWRVITISC
jgi:hypothetical protein